VPLEQRLERFLHGLGASHEEEPTRLLVDPMDRERRTEQVRGEADRAARASRRRNGEHPRGLPQHRKMIVAVDEYEIAARCEPGRVGPHDDQRSVDLAAGIATRNPEERNLPALQGLARVAVREAPVLQHVEESHAGR
jgi:hypothetical protein